MMKHMLARMVIEPAENGGHTVTHEFKPEAKMSAKMGLHSGYVEPEKHMFGKGESAKMTAHISQHLGLSNAKEEAEEE